MKRKKEDDLLDVLGFLKAQLKEDIENTAAVGKDIYGQSQQLSDIRAGNELLRERLAKLGISEEALAETYVEPEKPKPVTVEKIKLDANWDYHRAYLELLAEARQNGFENTRIEQLLSEEEIERAIAKSERLDNEFAFATRMDRKDMMLVSIGVAMHILRIYLSRIIHPKQKSSAYEDDMPLPGIENREEPLPGTDSGSKLDGIRRLAGALPFSRVLRIKSSDEILADMPSFQLVTDPRYPQKSDFLGNDALWGWIVGVMNIITDTVTARDLHTFQPMLSNDLSYLELSQEYLPLQEVFLPFVEQGTVGIKDSLIAAVIREAYILIPNEMNFENVADLFFKSRQTLDSIMSNMEKVTAFVSIDKVNDALMSAGWANLVNVILISVHGLFYKQDIPEKQYMVRTMKVVHTANVIGSILGSLPSVLMQDWSGLDYGGALTEAANMASLIKIMTDAKAEFLVSEYLPKLQNQLYQLDELFDSDES